MSGRIRILGSLKCGNQTERSRQVYTFFFYHLGLQLYCLLLCKGKFDFFSYIFATSFSVFLLIRFFVSFSSFANSFAPLGSLSLFFI